MRKPDKTISVDFKMYARDLEVYLIWLESNQYDQQKLYDWLMDDNRKPSQTHFTAGMTRTIAREIEFLLK